MFSSSYSDTNPPDVGAISQLHGLQATALNGQLGECLEWDSNEAKVTVRLLADEKIVSLKPTNLRAAPPVGGPDAASAKLALELAVGMLSAARAVQPGPAQTGALMATETKVKEALRRHPAYPFAYQLLSDVAHVRGDMPSMLLNARRAVANGGGCLARLALANAMGSMGDPVGEQAQLKVVLSAEPANAQARLNMGQSLCDSGQEEAAVEHLAAAVECAAVAAATSSLMRQVRDLASDKLCILMCRRGRVIAQKGDYFGAAALLRDALMLRPSGATKLCVEAELASVHAELRRLDEAEAGARRVLASVSNELNQTSR
jgi:hypothetical protein